MKLLEYNSDFEALYSNGIFNKEKYKNRLRFSISNDLFFIHEEVTEAVLRSLPLPKITNSKAATSIDLLGEIYSLGVERSENKISTAKLFREVDRLISENIHFPLIEKINQFNFETKDSFLFLFLIWKTINGSENVDLGRILDYMYDSPIVRIKEMQAFLTKQNNLVHLNLVEVLSAQFFNDSEVKLKPSAHQLLNDSEIDFFLIKKKKENIISPEEIAKRELIFDESEMKQLHTLENLLQEERFRETQFRLSEKGLPTGITVLLHGVPGTGKTEIVKQLARASNREIMKVEISQTKSKWFGESEKIIKRIFTDYASYAKESQKKPILFFNESDAVISKRSEQGDSTTFQTENAIQNILLEELENFEGILIATTNLVNNLDGAFDRRFLYKIHFQKPTTSIQSKIWKSKFTHLTWEECSRISEKFNLTGGQIDNIIRKSEVQQILQGTASSFEDLVSFCQEEKISFERGKVGF